MDQREYYFLEKDRVHVVASFSLQRYQPCQFEFKLNSNTINFSLDSQCVELIQNSNQFHIFATPSLFIPCFFFSQRAYNLCPYMALHVWMMDASFIISAFQVWCSCQGTTLETTITLYHAHVLSIICHAWFSKPELRQQFKLILRIMRLGCYQCINLHVLGHV